MNKRGRRKLYHYTLNIVNVPVYIKWVFLNLSACIDDVVPDDELLLGSADTSIRVIMLPPAGQRVYVHQYA